MRLSGGGTVHAVERIHDASEADERVLEHLAQLGCDPGTAREVSHYLYLPHADGADDVASILARGGWHTSTERCEDASHLVVATRPVVLSRAVVKDTRRALEALAKERGGIYDGWEARTG